MLCKTGKIIAVSVSAEKGVSKSNVETARLIVGEGLEGDAHAGTADRHISILCMKSMDSARAKGIEVSPGDFAENLTVDGLSHTDFEPGDVLRIGPTALARVTQIGKKCHSGCAIFKRVGDCVMPKEGIFAEVTQDGDAAPGNAIEIRKALGAAVVTVSDSTAAGKREDKSGNAIEAMLPGIPARLTTRVVVPDERDRIYKELKGLCARDDTHLIFTTGGTGAGPRDVTPEATRKALERELPGIAETIRAYGIQRARTAMLSRAVAGVAGNTIIVNLPGSEKGARESLEAVIDVLHHAADMALGGGH